MERYHRKLAKILDGQFSVEKEQVQGEIAALQEQLQAVRGQITGNSALSGACRRSSLTVIPNSREESTHSSCRARPI